MLVHGIFGGQIAQEVWVVIIRCKALDGYNAQRCIHLLYVLVVLYVSRLVERFIIAGPLVCFVARTSITECGKTLKNNIIST